jgi:hypothetical protein
MLPADGTIAASVSIADQSESLKLLVVLLRFTCRNWAALPIARVSRDRFPAAQCARSVFWG